MSNTSNFMRCSAWTPSEKYRKETVFVVSNNDQGLKFNHTNQNAGEILQFRRVAKELLCGKAPQLSCRTHRTLSDVAHGNLMKGIERRLYSLIDSNNYQGLKFNQTNQNVGEIRQFRRVAKELLCGKAPEIRAGRTHRTSCAWRYRKEVQRYKV